MLKGANILTTKEGHVKLADFGVATNLNEMDEHTVVGTPYWSNNLFQSFSSSQIKETRLLKTIK